MATVTLYVRDADAKLLEKAKATLGDSLSSVFMDCVRDRVDQLPWQSEAGGGKLKLTKVERVILANQYRLLEVLVPAEAAYFAQRREIVEKGYAIHYSEIDQWFYEEMEPEASREILDILNMFRALSDAADRKLSVGVNLRFGGFDGNDESSEFGYVTFLVERLQRFTEINTTELNSHWPMMGRYRAMLAEWRECKEKYELTQAEIDRIAAAAERN
jgi:uncharacterized protein YfbU (UPF0304 family)